MNTTPGAPTDAQIIEAISLNSSYSDEEALAAGLRVLSLHPAPSAAEPGAPTYAECFVCGRLMDGLSEDECHCFHRKEFAAAPSTAQGLSDAGRYQWLRSRNSWEHWNRLGHYGEGELDKQIDATILAAAKETK